MRQNEPIKIASACSSFYPEFNGITLVEILWKKLPQNPCKARHICKKREAEKIAVEVLLQVTVLSIEHMKKRKVLECSSRFAQHEHTKFAEISWWENYEILCLQMAPGRKTEQKQSQNVASIFMLLASRRLSLATRAEVPSVHHSCKRYFVMLLLHL